jgi:hypothetical protein
MPKMDDVTKYAISMKIVKLTREGFPQDQATAIAFRMWRDGELNLPPTPKQKKQQRDSRRRTWREQRGRRR